MIKFIIQFLFYSIMLFNLRVNADDPLEIIEEYIKKILHCPIDYPLLPQDLEIFDKSQIPDNENAKCFIACIYKNLGMIDDQGMFSVEGVNNIARIFMYDDSEWQKKADHYVEACLSVNDVEVSDGAKGCERTALMFKCRVEKAPEAEDTESLQQRHLEMVMKCAKDYPISAEDKVQFEKFQIPDSSRCLMACIYKSSGVMDGTGMLSVEGVQELARMFVSEDPERPKLAKQYTDACLSVNDMEVSDGDKGCDRAVLMFKCCMEKAPEFDYITEIVMKTVLSTQF